MSGRVGVQFAEVSHVRPGLLLATALVVSVVGVSTWLAAADYATIPPRGDFEEREPAAWTLTGPTAKAERLDVLRSAAFIVPPAFQPSDRSTWPEGLRKPVPSCRFA